MKSLEDRHWKAICLIWSGHTRKEVAEILGIKSSTLDEWYLHAIFQNALHEFQDILRTKVRQDISGMVVVALGVVRGLLQSRDEVSRRKGAELVFKIAGLGNEVLLVKERTLEPPRELTFEERMERLGGMLKQLDRVLNTGEPIDDILAEYSIKDGSAPAPVEKSIARIIAANAELVAATAEIKDDKNGSTHSATRDKPN